ncbi:MAG: hypothetical protein R3F14_11695 [Polyangiaceae bacterium]
MRTVTFYSFCLVGMLLQGCVESAGPIGEDEIADSDIDIDVGQGDEARHGPAANKDIDAKIATIDLPGGQVIFVDEGLTEPGGGIAFWELGNVNLSFLLNDQNATALEIYLALTPEGTPVPERLVEHHAEVATRVGGILPQPRHLVIPAWAPEGWSLTNEGLNDGGSSNDRDCWGWAGTGNTYSATKGYQSFNYSSFQSNFNDQYSQIAGPNVSSGTDVDNSYNADFGDFLGPTAAGHERAMAFCLSKAIDVGAFGLDQDCATNRGSAKVFVVRTTDSAYQSYVTADIITLTNFGHGGRFRSNYTNSGGGARKYALQVEWPVQSSEGSQINLSCVDELFLAWRSKWILGYTP